MAKRGRRYSADTKVRIAEAVAEARKTGTWKDAHAAAQKAGYRGNLDNLMKLVARKKAAKKTGSAKRAAPAPAAPTIAQTADSAAARPAPKKQKPKASPKPKAKRRNYDAVTKAAIVKAARAARNAGKKWPDALVAAKAAGYRGGLVSLILFVKAAAKAVKQPGRPAKTALVASAPKKRGRPPKVAAPAVPALDPVAANYLVSAIDKAIAELQKLRGQYAR